MIRYFSWQGCILTDEFGIRTWAHGVVTSYTYDPADRFVEISYSDTAPSAFFTYEYNALGMLQGETRNGMVIYRFYDTLGRSTGYNLSAPGWSPAAQEVTYA